MVSERALDSDEQILLTKVPADSSIGNTRLGGSLGWSADRYFAVRDRLVEKEVLAIGRGRGGSVYLVNAEAAPSVELEVRRSSTKERELYTPIRQVLEELWSRELQEHNSLVEVTAHQGRRVTGGMWTRPDLTVVAVSTYEYVPGKFLDIITYEVKPEGAWNVDGVFEAASHSRFATESHLLIHAPKGTDSVPKDTFARLQEECARFRIGLAFFADPITYDSFEYVLDAGRNQPSPADMERFIRQQLSERNKTKIATWLR
jgi:hypothetical protein